MTAPIRTYIVKTRAKPRELATLLYVFDGDSQVFETGNLMEGVKRGITPFYPPRENDLPEESGEASTTNGGQAASHPKEN